MTLDPGVLSPRMEGPSVRLRPVVRDDLAFLYWLATQPETGQRWRFRGIVPRFEAFAETAWSNVLCQFVIEDLARSSPVGHAVAYGADERDGIAYLGVVVVPELWRRLAGIEALVLLVDYLFGTWPFRILYFEVPEFNFDSIASGQGRFFDIEARLEDRLYSAGRYWALYTLSLRRERWHVLREQVSSLFGLAS